MIFSHHSIPADLLDDLCSRFLINLPPEDRLNLIRFCFHVEMAHWFYLDNYCLMYHLRPCDERTFAAHIFQHIPDLHKHITYLDTVLEDWRQYKYSIPTYGAIILDEDLSHVLLVQSFSAKTSWGFPKGKVNEDEEPWACAAREVLEETGFDISKLINKGEYINGIVYGKTIRLYIVTNVPHDTIFKPLTRNEIKSCEWFLIDDLPSTKKMNTSVSHKGFGMVTPFLTTLRHWVSQRKHYESTGAPRQYSMGSIEFPTAMNEIGISYELQNAVINYQEQNFYTKELQDAFRKYQRKNFPTQEPQNYFLQNTYQEDYTEELFIAYKKYLQCNQPFEKLLNKANQQQNLPYYKYKDGQLCQVQISPMTPNSSYLWSTNTSENNLSNLEKYYQQDLPTQQLKNALMIYDQQDFPYFEYQESQLYQEQCSPNNSHDWNNNIIDNILSMNGLLTPRDVPSPNAAVQKVHSCDDYYAKLSNFVAPSWKDSNFNEKAVLDSMT